MASQPQQLPPGVSGGITGGTADAQPRPLAEEMALAGGQQRQAAAATAAPTLSPPPGAESIGTAAAAGAAQVGGVTVWQPNRTVNALWSINQDKNSWVGFAGAGWMKLSTASSSGVVAMTMLASHAVITQTWVGVRTEADGMIHEMYVW
jgi:hypothetical protein